MAKADKATLPAVQSTAVMAFGSLDDNLPAHLQGQTGPGRGSEEVTSRDIVLPRLEIVQSNSAIKDVEGIEVKEGQLYNSATQEIFGDQVVFVPVYFRLEYLVWKDQDAGGGFFGSYMTEREANERRDDVIAGGEDAHVIEVVDTPVHYGLYADPLTGKTGQLVISMAKSKSKVSRRMNSLIQMVGGDRFARAYRFSTFKDKNKQGKTFYNYVVMPFGYCPEPLFRQAEELYNILKTQDFRANHEQVVENDGAVTERGDV